eukprot:3967390-Pleurochrysis_carterae.AAC.1
MRYTLSRASYIVEGATFRSISDESLHYRIAHITIALQIRAASLADASSSYSLFCGSSTRYNKMNNHEISFYICQISFHIAAFYNIVLNKHTCAIGPIPTGRAPLPTLWATFAVANTYPRLLSSIVGSHPTFQQTRLCTRMCHGAGTLPPAGICALSSRPHWDNGRFCIILS